MRPRPETTDHALELLARLAREHEALAPELEASLPQFFDGPPPAGNPAATLQHARRHLEWFLLERHSPSLFGVPAERLLDPWRAAIDSAGLEEAAQRALLESFTGAFEVTELAEDGAWLRDLAGLGDYALEETSSPLQPGDLLVGRLLPLGDGVHRPSPSMGLFRDADLRAAFERDLDQARQQGAKVLRLSQQELERLFFRTVSAEPEATDPVGEARDVLVEEGLNPDQAEAVLRELASHPFDPERLVPGAGDALGDLLDRLAFETSIDLGRTREALARAWPALTEGREQPSRPSASPASEPTAAPKGDRREALANFDAGRAAGRDLDELFRDLERDLELGGEAEADPDELAPAPDFPGVVSAMLAEQRWEVEQEHGSEAAARLQALEPLGVFAANLGRFEELDTEQLLRFTSFWLPERSDLTADGVRALLEALAEFCRWAQEAHELPLQAFTQTLVGLRESLPRVVELNRALPAPPEGAVGELFEVTGDSAGRYAGLVDRSGTSHAARVDQGLATRLRPGDRLRGEISATGELSLFRCYPPEAGGLVA